MIGDIFKAIVEGHLANYFSKKTGNPDKSNFINYGNISQLNEPSYDAMQNRIIMGLVNIEEDRISRKPDNYVRTPDLTYKKSPVYLNLYVLFAAHFEFANYDDSLNYIAWLITFFQTQNVFNPANTPNLPAGVEELIFDLRTLSFQDMNNLWGVLGSKYLPSVLYKVRMVSLSDDFTEGKAQMIQHVSINEQTIEAV